MQYECSVFIGRFQPFHLGHLKNIYKALKVSNKVIIIVGSSFRAPSIKNPFSFELREQMIIKDIQTTAINLKNIIIEPTSDWLYNEDNWRREVEHQVYKHVKNSSAIAIIGHNKDISSYYLHCFKKWQFIQVKNFKKLNATQFRENYFSESKIFRHYLVSKSETNGSILILKNFLKSKTYAILKNEYQVIKKCSNGKFLTNLYHNFVTVNSMIIINKHLLLIKKNCDAGKNLWAFPGGSLKSNERISDGIIRETFEGTNIEISKQELLRNKINVKVFDYPERSLSRRIIAHLGVFTMSLPTLPKIRPPKDVKDVVWLELKKVFCMQDKFINDHYQIIKCTIDKKTLCASL